MQHAEKREQQQPDKKDAKKDDAKVYISFMCVWVCVCARARAWLRTELLWMHLICVHIVCMHVMYAYYAWHNIFFRAREGNKRAWISSRRARICTYILEPLTLKHLASAHTYLNLSH
jgi:hypothetical protein